MVISVQILWELISKCTFANEKVLVISDSAAVCLVKLFNIVKVNFVEAVAKSS